MSDLDAIAKQIGYAAMRWRRRDLEALELEEKTSAAIFGYRLLPADYAGIDPAQKKIDKQWKLAAERASTAYDRFHELLAEAVAEQEDMFV